MNGAQIAMMGGAAALPMLDLIQSKALQGDPTSRALINAAGGTAGLAAGMMAGSRMGGGLGAALGGVAGYLGGGAISDRAMDMMQPEEVAPQAMQPQRPQFDQETMLRAQMAQLNQQKKLKEQQAIQMLNAHLQGQGMAG